jgi:hypothetical protein
VPGNDTYPTGSSFAQVTGTGFGPSNGAVSSFNASTGQFTYNPDDTFAGVDTFTYRVCLPSPNGTVCDTAIVVIVVTPSAVDDSYTTPYETDVTGDVSDNDIYPAGSQFAIVDDVANGAVVFSPNGTFQYTPDPGFTGLDTFTYIVCLPAPHGSYCDTAITVIVVGPIAEDDLYTTPFNTALNSQAVSGNDDYPAGSGFALVTPPAQGTLTFNSDGTFNYTPATDFSGVVSFVYNVCLPTPNTAVCDIATATIVVGPNADNDNYTTPFNTPLGANVNVNDEYPAGSSFNQLTDPPNGSIVFAPNGSFLFVPDSGFSGVTSFDYEVCLASPYAYLCETATVTITVGAQIQCNITCGPDLTSPTDNGVCYATLTLSLPSLGTNCGSGTLGYLVLNPDNSVSGPFNSSQLQYQFQKGLSKVTWSFESTGGDVSTCEQFVTVTDGEDPVITCPSNASFGTNNLGLTGDCAGTYRWNHPLPTDNCELLSYNYQIIGANGVSAGPFDLTPMIQGAPAAFDTSQYDFPLGTSQVLYFVSDESGNSAVCSMSVSVVDNESPTFVNCPAGVTFTVALSSNNCTTGAIWSIPVATDNCGAAVSQTAGPSQGTLLGVGTYPITYTATDAAGNTGTCNFTIEVVNNQGPTIVCPGNIFINDTDPSICSWTAPAGSLTPLLASSNCSAAITYTVTGATNTSGTNDASGITFNLGTSTVTYTITETGSGQSMFCSFEVTVEDGESPAITCAANVAVSTDPGACDAALTLALPGVSDNCSGSGSLTLSYTVNNPDNSISGPFAGSSNTYVFSTGYSQVVWNVTDAAGNSTECTQQVSVSDTQAPVLNCPVGSPLSFTNSPGICGYEVPAIGLNATASDNCGISSLTHDYGAWGNSTSLEGAVFPVGQTTVTWSATDVTGYTTVCSIVVNVTDTEDPQFVNCQASISVNADVDKCGANVNYTQPLATDNCGVFGVLQTQGLPSGSNFPVGTSTLEWTAVDAAGNTITCTTLVIVADMQKPTAICKDVTVNLSSAGVATIAAADLDGGSYDNCTPTANLSFSASVLSFTCQDLGNNNVVLTATDGNSNSSNCVSTVTVVDATAPTFTCPGTQTVVGCEGLVPDVVSLVTNAADNCGVATVTQDPAAGVQIGNTAGQTQQVTVTVTDGSGNTSSCVVTLNIVDNIAPSFVNCPATLEVNTDIDECNANVNFALPVATDNCAGVTVAQTSGLPSGSSFPLGNSTLVFTATDATGNTSTCTTVVTVTDEQAPAVVCQDITINLNAAGTASIVPGDLNGGSSDNCTPTANLSLSASVLNFNCQDLGNNNVVLTATDADGNSSSCVSTVTVVDATAPTFTCPATQTVVGCEGLVPDVVSLVTNAADNCGVATVTQDPAAGVQVGNSAGQTQQVTVTVTDGSGNTSSCVVTLNIVDNIAPSFANCPAALTASTDVDECSANVNFALPVATDNCAGVTVAQTSGLPSGSSFPLGNSTLVFTATDAAGNTSTCTTVVTVTDEQAPAVVCQDITINLNAAGTASIVPGDLNGGSSDNCTPTANLSLSASVLNFNCQDLGNNNVVLTATDADGNSSSCVSTVTVVDAIVPTFTCPGTQTVVGCEGLVPDVVSLVTNAADNCGVATVTQDPAAGVQVGNSAGQTQQVTVTVTDGSGNTSSCVVTLNIVDNIAPSFVNCPAALTASTDVDECSANVNFALPVATDNCAGVTVVQTSGLPSGSSFPLGNSTLVFTATDAAGNTSTCTTVVTVTDEQAPAVVCQDITINLNAAGTASIVPGDLNGGSSDNCTPTANLSLSASVLNFNCQDLGNNNVVLTATDADGNSSSCVSTVTVVDAIVPTFICPPNQTVTGCNGLVPNLVSQVMNAADNCGIASITQNPAAGVQIGNTGGQIQQATVTVTDLSGNTSSCTVQLTITDNQPPVFTTCPSTMIMIGNDVDQCSGKLNWPIPAAVDNCGLASVTQIAGPASGSVVQVCQLLTVTYQATDVNGNSSTCSFNVQVIDTQKPSFDADVDMPANATVNCQSVPAPFVLTNNDVNDNCTSPQDLEITYNQTSTQSADPASCNHYNYTLTRTWTVKDAVCATGGGGNTRSHTQVITVQDVTAPVAVCQDVQLTLDVFGQASITAASINGGSTDNCAPAGVLTLQASKTAFDCSNVGANTVTLIVGDPCGNTSTCNAEVTVAEGIAPCNPTYDIIGSDPCVCMNNATNLQNGQFGEFVQVEAIAGQTWTVQSNTGLYLLSSPAPPAAPVLIPIGTPMILGDQDGVDNDGNGLVDEFDEKRFYALRGLHVDSIGFIVKLVNQVGESVTVSNKCYYPTPAFVGLDDPFCLNSPASAIEMIEKNGSVGTISQVTINGVPANTFDPAQLGVGTHIVSATFDAGTATGFSQVNGVPVGPSNQDALADAGCQQTLTIAVQVVGTPAQVNCNDLLQVSLDDADCENIIHPDMLLEGSYYCYDDYSVVLSYPAGTNSFNPANVVDQSHAGEVLYYSIVHVLSGNVCWGQVKVEDKLPPVLTCPATAQILCTQDKDDLTLTGGSPAVTDCSDYLLNYTDDYEQFSCSQNPTVRTRITRSWIATDQWSNSDTCVQIIDVLRGTTDQVAFPANLTLSCSTLPNGATPDYTGWPTIGGINLNNQGNGDCGISAVYSDQVLPYCEGSYEVLRTWTVKSICAGGTGITHVQSIVVEDAAPTITLPTQSYDPANDWYVISATEYSIDPYQACVGFGPLPLAIVDGVCNAVVSVEISTPVGITANGGLLPAPGLPAGVHQITYSAKDACGNLTQKQVKLLVVDDIAPSVVCESAVTANLSSTGLAELSAASFDNGTIDNCCLAQFEVRRMDGDCAGNSDDFGPTVTFCCEDVTAPVMVVFRAYDCEGNYNECMVTVDVNDKQNPTLVSCPANQRITCDVFAQQLETNLQGLSGVQINDFLTSAGYGEPTFADNCEVVLNGNASVNLDQCLEGAITRTWTAKDLSDNAATGNCTQTIFVDHVSDWVVEFPADLTVNCGNTVPDFGEPEIFNETCELVAVSFADVVFTVVPDACYKIERTWVVINWCVVGAEIDQEVLEASEQQMNLDMDGDGDKDNRTFRDSWTTTAKPDANSATLLNGPDTDMDSDPWDGYITYKQVIKVNDTVNPEFADGCSIPDVCIDGNSCNTTLTLPQPAITECSPDVTLTAKMKIGGVWLDGFGPYQNVGPGTYEVVYNAKDNCNNQQECSSTVTVKDCKKPTPYCENGLVVEIMTGGMITVNVSSLDAGSYDNCTAQADLALSFSADVTQTSLTFDCEQLGQNAVELWVTDGAGNQDFCETFIEVQDNMGTCSGNPLVSIAGTIATAQSGLVAGVMVEINGGTYSQVTGQDGQFSIQVPAGADYTVTPILDENVTNGVTTFDLVLIQHHILGMQLLNSPYKLIAADANNSGGVTTFDMVVIRKIILLIDDQFPNNTSWRFVDKDYVFQTPQNPWSDPAGFPEVMNYNDMTTSSLSADFVAIKIGDVNGSALTNLTGTPDDRSGADWNLRVKDELLKRGQTLEVPVFGDEPAIFGYQFTLELGKQIELVEVKEGVAGVDNFGYTLLERHGVLTASWNDRAVRRLSPQEPLFTLVLKARKDLQLSQEIMVSSRFTTAEAYGAEGELLRPVLGFGQEQTAYRLYQNAPNPFREETTISFSLPESTTVTLRVWDAQGRELYRSEAPLEAGYHQVPLTLETESSILYYRLETAAFTATRMMVKVN